jgi:hypothetical protein
VGKSALLFDFIKAYGVDGIEDYLEGMICCGCRMGEKRGEKGGKSDDRGQTVEDRDQRSEVRSILFSFGQLTRSLQVTVQVSEG